MIVTVVITALAAGLCGAGVVAGVFLLLRRNAETADRDARRDADVRSMELANLVTQSEQRFQDQERVLTKMLDERLGQVTHRLGETLDRNTKTQKTVLDSLTERLVKIDAAQKNLDQLSSEVVGLQDILSNKQARGAFGEVQLANLVAEILPPGHFELQKTLCNGRRVDCLLLLPNPPGDISIDAKFPLESYRAMLAAHDEAVRTQAKRRFVGDVTKHIKDIEERYIVAGETADAALMFLPSEAVYAELHANFGDVVEKSYRSRVFIVSPTTLWATLNTVRAVMRDVHMKEAAGVIQTEVMKMLEDVARLSGRVGKLQKHFEQTGEDLRQINISTEKVMRRGEHIQEIQIEDKSGDALTTEPEGEAQIPNIITGPRVVRSVND